MSLDQFDSDFTPYLPGRTPGLDSLADGEGIYEIVDCDLFVTKGTGDTVFKMGVKVLSGPSKGNVAETVRVLRGSDDARRLGSDLLALGFDCQNWTVANGKPFSKMLPEAIQVMAGITFKGAKVSGEGRTGNRWHALNIYGRTTEKTVPADPFA